jgi:hypothetical protein
MKVLRLIGVALTVGAVGLLTSARAKTDPEELKTAGTDAYLFGYPLVTMEMTRRVQTNAVVAGEANGRRAPMGQFARMRTFPTPEDRAVTAPNADTLYEVAWMDLSRDPYVLSIPDMKGRYFLLPLLDAWTNVFDALGSRTTGTAARTFAITGPEWRGSLPAGAREVRSPTNLVWIVGRVASDGTPGDLAEVHDLQDRTTLAPLSALGKPLAPPHSEVDAKVDMKTPVRDQVDAMDAVAFFKVLAESMKKNRPAAEDAPILPRLASLGIVPGADFEPKRLSREALEVLRRVPRAAQEKIAAHAKSSGLLVDGWQFENKEMGRYGTDYLQRASVAAFGLGANLPQDAVYPRSYATGAGERYDGANRYVLRFEKGQLPPVRGFWSATMYDDHLFFAANRLNRYTRGDRDALVRGPDGSVSLYLQKESPGADKEANWLPAPDGKFILMLRMYWPNETAPTILNGSWKPPPVKRTP